jgi:hypothetical protein
LLAVDFSVMEPFFALTVESLKQLTPVNRQYDAERCRKQKSRSAAGVGRGHVRA